MWIVAIFFVCLGAYLAGRSRFWHIAIARFLTVSCALYLAIVIGSTWDWRLAVPVLFVYPAAIIFRWIFRPHFPTASTRILWALVDRANERMESDFR